MLFDLKEKLKNIKTKSDVNKSTFIQKSQLSYQMSPTRNFKSEDWKLNWKREEVINSAVPDYEDVNKYDQHSYHENNIFETLSLAVSN